MTVKKELVKSLFVLFILLSALYVSLLMTPVAANPAEITVPDDYEKIQWAIENASAGDIILVKPGIYYENVTVDKSLTLLGEDPSTTIIDTWFTAEAAIRCLNVDNVKISGFTIQNGTPGIEMDYLTDSIISDNVILGSTITNYGVFLVSCNNITVRDNKILNNYLRGIYLRNYATNNILYNNTISSNGEFGLLLFNHSSNNLIYNNTIVNNGRENRTGAGIRLYISSSNNNFSGNTIANNRLGMIIDDSPNNILRNNNFTGNEINFKISFGTSVGPSIQNIDDSNMVDGKPVIYWVNQHDKQVPVEAGYVALVNSRNITVRDLNLAKNAEGVLLAFTSNSTIANVNASYNSAGIRVVDEQTWDEENQRFLASSSYNVINSSILANNSIGIELTYSNNNLFSGNTLINNFYGVSSNFCNNTFYHNNFINNINKTLKTQSGSVNKWDNGYPSGGNYWSDYNGTDANEDGIGDFPRLLDEDNKDNYPLMAPVITVDQIMMSDEWCDVGSLQTVVFHVKWAHNNSDTAGGSIYINGTRYNTNNTGWLSFNASYDDVGKHVWIITGSRSFSIIWDRIRIVRGGVSNTRTSAGRTATVWFDVFYEYEHKAFDGSMGTVYVNESAMTWSSENNRWEHSYIFNTNGTRAFQVSGVTDNQYGLMTIMDDVGPLSITWEKIGGDAVWMQWWFWTAVVGIGALLAVAFYLKSKKAGKSRKIRVRRRRRVTKVL